MEESLKRAKTKRNTLTYEDIQNINKIVAKRAIIALVLIYSSIMGLAFFSISGVGFVIIVSIFSILSYFIANWWMVRTLKKLYNDKEDFDCYMILRYNKKIKTKGIKHG